MAVTRDGITLHMEALDDFPKPLTPKGARKGWPSRYGQNAPRWSDTLDILMRELYYLNARSAVLLVAVGRDGFRIDGSLRANAKAEHPGVVLNVTTRFGPLQFATDLYTHWEHNARAIGLALEGLRRMDRYGITRSGQQYTGWRALPPGAGESEPEPPEQPEMTAEEAINVVCTAAGADDLASLWQTLPQEVQRTLIRTAQKKTHPDTGGSDAEFKIVALAIETIEGSTA